MVPEGEFTILLFPYGLKSSSILHVTQLSTQAVLIFFDTEKSGFE
jgi:hypothetical protein